MQMIWYCGVPGVPGVPNADFEKLMGTTMSTVYYRAARVKELFTL